jgi:glucose dehydrogenase
MGTIDAHLIAIDAKTGKILWDHTVEKVGDKAIEKFAITHAPVVIKDKIVVGTPAATSASAVHLRVRREDRQGTVADRTRFRRKASRATRRVRRFVEDRRRRRLEQRRA